MIGRRGFITGLGTLVAAPAIVRAGSLMPVRVWSPPLIIRDGWLVPNGAEVPRAVFADLFAAVGTSWGSRSDDTFTLPVVPGHLIQCEGTLSGMVRWVAS